MRQRAPLHASPASPGEAALSSQSRAPGTLLPSPVPEGPSGTGAATSSVLQRGTQHAATLGQGGGQAPALQLPPAQPLSNSPYCYSQSSGAARSNRRVCSFRRGDKDVSEAEDSPSGGWALVCPGRGGRSELPSLASPAGGAGSAEADAGREESCAHVPQETRRLLKPSPEAEAVQTHCTSSGRDRGALGERTCTQKPPSRPAPRPAASCVGWPAPGR